MGLNAVTEAASTPTLEQPVHFTSSDNNYWRRHGPYMLSMQPIAVAVGQEKRGSAPLKQLVLAGKVEVAVERYLISRAA